MKFIKPRKWTDDEVRVAIDYIKFHQPGLWERCEQVELSGGEFTDTKEATDEYKLLFQLHKECPGAEIVDLYCAVRRLRQQVLGISRGLE